MQTLKDYLKQDRFISDLKSLPAVKKRKIYIVGGFLRDFLLKRKAARFDLDFAVDKDAISLARKFAKKIKAGFVILDKRHGCARVVKYKGNKSYIFDFSDFRCKDIKRDLLKRDFTINALALNLKNTDKLVDLTSGLQDLKTKIIRVVSDNSFKDDSLRIMRAFSLSAELNFKIEPQTFKLIKKYKRRITDSAYERIRDELFKILNTSCAYAFLNRLDNLSILELIVPEIRVMKNIGQGPYHHLNVWEHSKETLRQLELALEKIKDNEDIANYLKQNLAVGRSRYQLIKLAALLHDIGKPQSMRIEADKRSFHGHERVGLQFIRSIVKRLKLSNIEEDGLQNMVLWHLRPGYLSDIKVLSPRAKFRYFRDTKDEAVSVLLISLADQRATCGPLTKDKDRTHHEEMIQALITEYFNLKKQKPLKRLIGGNDLIKEFKLKPGPVFTKILKEVEERQAVGKIKTKKEALEYITQHFKLNLKCCVSQV